MKKIYITPKSININIKTESLIATSLNSGVSVTGEKMDGEENYLTNRQQSPWDDWSE